MDQPCFALELLVQMRKHIQSTAPLRISVLQVSEQNAGDRPMNERPNGMLGAVSTSVLREFIVTVVFEG
jgi:hypothetical protein